MVDADPARRHVLMLQERGLGTRRIAALAGLNRKAVLVLSHGRADRGTPPPAKIHRETAGRLLAVRATLESFGDQTIVPSAGGVLQLRALLAAGWLAAQLAERLGVAESNFARLLNAPKWHAATVRAVVALYEELRNRTPSMSGSASVRL